MIVTGVLMFQIGGSQLVGARKPTWQDPRRERGLHQTSKIAKQNLRITKWLQTEIQTYRDIALYGKAQYIWKDKTGYSKEYNKNKSCRTIFSSRKNVFRFSITETGGSQFMVAAWPTWQKHSRLLFFFCRNLVFRLGTPFSVSVSKNFTSAFFVGYRRKLQLFVEK